ncbi:hypothetical protein FBU30_007872 [Linnemannia zychae]|nr:hypothetical protein FBU30_007872 [Linnemannia zychae]
MSQKDINLRTLELYNSNQMVPEPEVVDRNVVIVAESTVHYANELLGLANDFDYTRPCNCHSMPHTY